MGSTASEIFSVRSQVEHSNVRISNPRRPAEMRANAILCLQTGHIGRSFGEHIRFTSASYDFSLCKFDRQFSSSWNVPVRVNWPAYTRPSHLDFDCLPSAAKSFRYAITSNFLIFFQTSKDHFCARDEFGARGNRRSGSARPRSSRSSCSQTSSCSLDIDRPAGQRRRLIPGQFHS